YLGGVARFECNINSVPQPSYVWQKDGNKIPQDNRYTTFSSGVLQITNLKYEDAGLYRCIAYISGIGDGIGNRHFKMLAPPQNITGIYGETAELECLIDGYPLPGVIWTRKGMTWIFFLFYGWLRGDKLVVLSANPNHSGYYQCIGDNGIGQVMSTGLLKVFKKEVPSAPTNITWEIVSPGIVEIHWHPPTEPNGVITSYIIFYNIDESLPDTKWNNVTQNGK
ncbi:hypothetical protein LOTGIDRAFT_138929, partial [Lottia gigantea]